METFKLNIGCGSDYRDGFINIDGSDTLDKVDKIINLPLEDLINYFKEGSVSFILCNDFIEHHFHWDAIKILKEFFIILTYNGAFEIRVPDCEYIIKKRRISIERQLTLLYGGQDIPQGIDPEMDESRKKFPQFFCHKYGWTRKFLKKELQQIGFSNIKTKRVGTNFIIKGTKK